jgi:PBSX family phage portal protein
MRRLGTLDYRMADRIARAVTEEEDMLPVIENVFTLGKTDVVDTSGDPFLASGDEVKSLRGVSPVTKRRVSNEIRKYAKSADGEVGSQQVEQNYVTGYDAFGVIQPPHQLDGLAKIYEVSTPHYAAVNAKVANIAGLGYNLVESRAAKRKLEGIAGNAKALERSRKQMAAHKAEVEDWLDSLNDEETINEVLEKVWRDYEVTGNGYIEVGRRDSGVVGYIGHIPSQTMRVRKDRDGFVQISGQTTKFFKNFGEDASNPIGNDQSPNEIIHIKRYSPAGGTYYGVPDIIAAEQAVVGSEFAARFNLDYFENKAVPRHVITLKGANLGVAAQAELLAFFETGLKGQNHRSIFIPLPGDDATNKVEFKIDPVEAGIQDSSFNNYDKNNMAKVLMAHRVPVSKVSTAEGASLAIARDADKTFKEQVCQPEQFKLEKKVNRIVKEFTDAYEFKLNEMTLTDDNTQSQIDERMVKNGIWTANEVRNRRGMPSLEGGDERVDLNAKAKADAVAAEAAAEGNRARDAERSANQTDGTGEARNPKGDGRTTP